MITFSILGALQSGKLLGKNLSVTVKQISSLRVQGGGQQAPDALHAGAGRQVPRLHRRLGQPGARRQAALLGQVHELRPDLRGPGLRPLQQGAAFSSEQYSNSSFIGIVINQYRR